MTSMKKPPAGDAAKGAEGSTRNDPTAEGNTKQALGFIEGHSKSWLPGWYIQLVAIEPDGLIKAVAVHPDQIESLGPWIEQHNGEANLYFAVNPLRRDPGKKASKDDIVALAYHHADLDPLDGEAPDAAKKRLLAAVEALSYSATELIDSGNGLGVFYRLTEPILHDGNADALEQINKRLAQHFGGDSCHNIDRVMRLPGTVNLPTKTKLKKGRVTVPAQLLEQNANTYSPDDFTFLPPVAEKAKAGAPVLDFDTSSIDELSLATRYTTHQQFDPNLKLLLEGKAPAWVKDDSGSGLDNAYALTLSMLKYSPAEALWLLSKYQHGKTSRERDQKYLETTINKHYAPKEKEPVSANADARSWLNLTLKDGAVTDDDLRKEDPPWECAIDNFRPRKVGTIFCGAHGVGKSSDALGQELAVATGRPHWGMPVTQGRAIFISCEDPRRVIKARIQAWLKDVPDAERPRAEADLRKNFFFFGNDETNGMKLTVKAFAECQPNREAVEHLIALGQGVVSITVETIAMLNGGDEMNTDLMQMALVINEIARRTGASVQVIHHVSKEARGRKPDSYSARGGSSLADAARSVVVMQELSDEQMQKLSITRLADAPVFGLYHVKSSYSMPHPPIYIRRLPGPRYMQVNASEAQGKEHARNRFIQFLQKTENREGVSVRYLMDNCTKLKIEKREVESVLLELEALHMVNRVDSTELGKKGPRHDIWKLNSLL
jgi:RecA-family ATPase